MAISVTRRSPRRTPPTRDVTGLSSWSTSDNTIATVNSVGFVTVYKLGDVAVRANYQDLDGFETMRVEPGGFSYYDRALSGWVRDAQDNSTLPGATVLILDGANSGRTTTVRPDGAYLMVELQPGTFTVRFSRAGYVTKDLTFTPTGDRLLSLDATLPRSSP
jgi:carboxypeptidase family protein